MAAMSAFTLTEIDTQLTAWKSALLACASGQSYRMDSGGNSRQLAMSDLPEIRRTITWLQTERNSLTNTSRPCTAVMRPAR